MKNNNQHNIFVSHFVGLSGVGGVQRNFVEYINNQIALEERLLHKIYTLGEVDSQYKMLIKVYDIRQLKNLFALILDIVSRRKIVHFYNNLTSLKVAVLLLLLPVRKLIIHERGTIWNQQSSSWLIPYFIAWKASIVLSNSFATKTMLVKKFSIPNKKIRVLHNGVSMDCNCGNDYKKNKSVFRIGFIGRLDSPKGVHVLIDTMHHLRNKNIELIIAGEGILENALKQAASKLNSVEFIGRINNPYSFLDKIDLLVVPSIREPLGNVCLEAGLCKTPVLATNVDGIPEIIEHKISGELIDATDEISIDLPEGAVPLPEFVVNPANQQLCTPKQINPSLLAKKILELSSKPEKLKYYANELHTKVTNYFNINRYRTELYNIYHDLYHL